MNMLGKLPFLMIAASIFMSFSPARAAVDTDAMFIEARQLATSGKRKEASEKCNEILAVCPECHDARMLLGRIRAWDKDYPAARAEFDKVLAAKPGYEEAVEALIDVELWSGAADKALSLCDNALKTNPGKSELLRRRALALESLGRPDEAKAEAAAAVKADPKNADAANLLARMSKHPTLNSASLSFSHDAFDSAFSSWSNLSLSLSRRFQFGPVIFSANGARRFNRQTVQLELEAYPRIAKNAYLWLDAGVSNGTLFPASRLGLEIYTSPAKTYETSVGVRHLNFSSNNANIYTASIAKYQGRWYVSARPYYSRKNGKNSYSGNVSAKRYFKDGVNYFGFSLGAGSSPSESIYAIDTARLDSNSIGVEWQRSVGPATFLKLNLGYGEEDYAGGAKRRKRYSFGLSIKNEY